MIESVVETITPQMAIQYLGKSNGNIDRSPKLAEVYAHDMRNGRWEMNGQAIVFDEDGVLKDGHTRLNAIIKAQTPVQMLVTRGVPRESNVYDLGKARSQRQYQMYNRDMPSYLSSYTIIAVGKIAAECRGIKVQSVSERADWLQDNQRTLCWVSSMISKGKHSISRKAVFAFALFCAAETGEDRMKLGRFVDIINSGLSESPEEWTAIICRDYLTKMSSRNGFSSMDRLSGRIDQTAYIQQCMYDFCSGVKRSKPYRKYTAVYTDRWLKMVESK